MNKYHWEATDTLDGRAVRQLSEAFDIPTAGARFLAARSYTTPELASAYLFADDIKPHDPFLFDNMERAVTAVQQAIAAKQRILIHGDYDVDGISGTALLYHYLGGLVPDVFRFLPDRRKDGYGVADRAVDWAIEKQVGLFIAVDCGTSDGDKIERLESAGIEAVICDHHEFPVDREARGIMLNPVREGETYPFEGLCGTGVAFKLVQALESKGIVGDTPSDTLLDLTALATVGDLAPLVDENRLFVRAGLRRINDGARVGLEALKNVSGRDVPEVTSWHIGFVLAPRLNAPGRIANAKPALEILCTADRKESVRLASLLDADNTHRRELTERVKDDVVAMIRSMDDLDDRGGFILAGSDWDEGVLGIAASRVVEEFGKPALLISVTDDIGKGSGRSVRGVHLKEQLDLCRSYLERYGGHAQAVGVTIQRSKIDDFVEALNGHLKAATAELPKKPVLRIDTELRIAECSMELIDFLATCEPFGLGNRNPVWRISNVTITSDTRFVGNGHLKTHFRDGNGDKADGISFYWGRDSVPPDKLHGKVVDLAVRLKRGYYLNKHYAEIHVVDIRQHEE